MQISYSNTVIITTRTNKTDIRHLILTNIQHNFLLEQNAPFLLNKSELNGTRSFKRRNISLIKSYISIFRYLLQSKGKDRTPELFLQYQESLKNLHEMAETLINKRLIC